MKRMKTLERAAWITGIIGMLGVVTMFYLVHKGNDDENNMVEAYAIPDSVVITPTNAETKKKENAKKVELKKKQETINSPIAKVAVKPTNPIKEPTKETKPKKIKDTIAVVAKPAKTDRQLSTDEMLDILSSVKAKKTVLGFDTKCVQLKRGSNSNVSNWLQVADFLNSKGYVIAGREILDRKARGISVEPGTTCIIVTIGTL